jgi:type II secretory pathway pseudopilin PulG
MRPMRSEGSSPESGFSLIELLLGMVIAVELLVAALTVFDVHNRMSRVQMQITEVQQAVRVAQYDVVRTVRMAGRGGLDTNFVPVATGTNTWLASRAIEVRNNLIDDADREVATGYTDSPLVMPGTDMLIVRGCLSGPLFQFSAANPTDFQADPGDIGTVGTLDLGRITLRKETIVARDQNLSQFRDLQFFDSGGGHFSPILLQSAITRGVYTVAEVNSLTVNGPPEAPTDVVIELDFLPNDDTPNNPFVGLTDPDFSVAFACVLEEYRYYIRENYADPGATPLVPLPRLSRARMIPGTETPYRDDIDNLSLDLADEIIDLQVALAFDTDYDADGTYPGAFGADSDSEGNDDVVYEAATDDTRDTDDWLWNSSLDNPNDLQWQQWRVTATSTPQRPAKLLTARVTIVGRSARPDPGYDAPDLDAEVGHDWLEDTDYDAAPANAWKQGSNRNHRRRSLQTTIDMRNI